jgi:hypothetical protein
LPAAHSGNFTSSTNELGSAPEAIWKTMWKETVLSGILLLVAQPVANHFND